MKNQLITKELLQELYWKEKMSIRKIANEYFNGLVSPATILKYMMQFGIKRRIAYRDMTSSMDFEEY
jgi:hypothetical protein